MKTLKVTSSSQISLPLCRLRRNTTVDFIFGSIVKVSVVYYPLKESTVVFASFTRFTADRVVFWRFWLIFVIFRMAVMSLLGVFREFHSSFALNMLHDRAIFHDIGKQRELFFVNVFWWMVMENRSFLGDDHAVRGVFLM